MSFSNPSDLFHPGAGDPRLLFHRPEQFIPDLFGVAGVH